MSWSLRLLFFAACTLAAPVAQADPAAQPATLPESVVCPILIYHAIREYRPGDTATARQYIITPETLEQELQFLKDEHATPVSFEQLADSLEKGVPLPPDPVIISFDDGWESQYRVAFPLLQKFGFRATFFIFTNGINAKHFMTADQLKELADAGMEIGCHSRSHPYLAKMSDPAALRREIFDSREKLERVLGRTITAFAYPFGHYTNQIVEMVKQAGYRSARSTYNGVRHTRADLFTLTGLIDITNVARIESGLRAAEELAEKPEYPPPGIDVAEYFEGGPGY
jgi:peptidoglycan/xylan/chitin deacetylase (PgdA/CDA1 family)